MIPRQNLRTFGVSAVFVGAFFALAPAHAQSLPNDFAALASRAAAARDANRPRDAIALYQQALDINPGWKEGWWMAGSLQYESDLFAAGEESLNRLAKITPQAGPVWALLGLCEYETGHYDAAFEHISRSLSLGVGNQPQMTLVLQFHRAALLAKRGHFDEALREYAGFIPARLTDDQVVLGLGLAHLREAKTPSEIPGDQRDLFRYTGRALAAFLTNDTAAAKAAYEDLIFRFPHNADAHYALGYFLFASDPDRALEQWRQALAVDSGHAGAHAMSAWAYWLREESQPAYDHATSALQRDPAFTIARIVLGRLAVNGGRTAAGIEHLEQAEREDPANLEAHLALASAYSAAGRKPDASRERQLCLELQAKAAASAQN